MLANISTVEQNARQQALLVWLEQHFSGQSIVLTQLSGDAGFRRYFRIRFADPTEQSSQHRLIAVDAPPESCNNAQFIAVQKLLAAQQVKVPNIIACELTRGFFCLSDLGERLLAQALTPDNMPNYYRQALRIALTIADIKAPATSLPLFDAEFMQRELMIFVEWLLHHHLSIELTAHEQHQLQQCFTFIIIVLKAQPQVVMHRDFHSRNLMLVEQQLAVIDFQDAVLGPITYDAVSLLRDCYVRWPAEQIEPLFNEYCQHAAEQFKLKHVTKAQWLHWFDLTGLQRHLKAAGIFARLHHRDHKSHYLKDIPLTLSYVLDVSAKYPELTFIYQLVNEQVLPAMARLKHVAH